MARTVAEAPLTTRNARSKLAEGVHWRGLDAEIHLGYRKGARGGKWVVRWYGGAGRYTQEPIAAADDSSDADGQRVLSFNQAKAKALGHVAAKRAEAIASADGPMPTVRTAIAAYLDAREARERQAKAGARKKHDARIRLTKHVLSDEALADAPLHTLTELDLERWRSRVSGLMAPATVKRLANDFKAALNAAAIRHRKKLPAEFAGTVKTGLAAGEASSPVARDAQALSDAEVRRVLDAARAVDEEGDWAGDLFRLVLVLAATGARFSQVQRMTVADVQAAKGRLMMPVSRKGRGAKSTSHIAVRVGEDVLAELRPAVAGRRSGEALLERWRHKQMPKTSTSPPRWVRDTRGPWGVSDELSRPWRLLAAKAGLPADVVPYSLRHSSIVRQLRMGLPVRLVAAWHDTSAAMIESHYSAAIVDALDALAAGAVIPLVSNQDEKVVQLRRS